MANRTSRATPGMKGKQFKWDAVWWDNHADELTLLTEGSYRGMYQWSGEQTSPGSAWDVQMPKRECCNGFAFIRDWKGEQIIDANEAFLRRPCMAAPNPGMDVCDAHGGNSPELKRRAVERLTAGADVAVSALIQIIRSQDADDKDRIAAVNSLLDRAGIRAGVEVEVTSPGYEKVWKGLMGINPDDSSE